LYPDFTGFRPHSSLGSGERLDGEGKKPELERGTWEEEAVLSSTNVPFISWRALDRARAEARGSLRDGSRTEVSSAFVDRLFRRTHWENIAVLDPSAMRS